MRIGSRLRTPATTGRPHPAEQHVQVSQGRHSRVREASHHELAEPDHHVVLTFQRESIFFGRVGGIRLPVFADDCIMTCQVGQPNDAQFRPGLVAVATPRFDGSRSARRNTIRVRLPHGVTWT